MTLPRNGARWPLWIVCLLALGCSEPIPTEIARPMSVISPMCQAGCTEPDPFPVAPGVFLGSSVTPEVCIDAGLHTDADRDLLSDFCEKNLAAAFAPELAYWQYDEVGREPRWVARVRGEDSVLIGYLFSYYRDVGNQPTLQCKLPLIFGVVVSSCNGHNGDSEMVYLVVSYDANLSHWILRRARYFRHSTFGEYLAGPSDTFPRGLIYPGKRGSYPRVYVANGKHGSYATRSECNGGGSAGSDSCEDIDTHERVAAGASLNIGSRSFHSTAQDCIVSSNPAHPYAGSGKQECYWTARPFRGWYPDSVGGGEATGYSDRLSSIGF